MNLFYTPIYIPPVRVEPRVMDELEKEEAVLKLYNLKLGDYRSQLIRWVIQLKGNLAVTFTAKENIATKTYEELGEEWENFDYMVKTEHMKESQIQKGQKRPAAMYYMIKARLSPGGVEYNERVTYTKYDRIWPDEIYETYCAPSRKLLKEAEERFFKATKEGVEAEMSRLGYVEGVPDFETVNQTLKESQEY